MNKKVIGFWDNNLSLRGTSVAVYTYAKYNEEILGNISVIFSNAHGNLDAIEKFQKRFPGRVHLVPVEEIDRCETILLRNYSKYEPYFYSIKQGIKDEIFQKNIKNLVHAVFKYNEPHGHRYMYVSDWLSEHMGYSPREDHAVPHIVEPLPTVNGDLREDLNIPKNATVFGCYGGSTEFNIHFVHETMDKVLSERKDIYFIFMNIQREYFQGMDHPFDNVRYLPGTWNLEYKAKFVNTCDAMLHARQRGETFGLSVAEFSSANKPVITFGGSGEACHLEILGERALKYNNSEELYNILTNFEDYVLFDNWNCYKNFSPELIMGRFNKNFLQD